MQNKYIKWLKAAGIRAIRTFFQAFGAGILVGAGIKDIDWLSICSVAFVAAIASMCTSLGGLPELDLEEDIEGMEDDRND